MTDAGRKDFSSKAKESMTPDSQKSTTDKVSESVSGATDKASREVMPDSQKSGTQAAGDKAGSAKDDAAHGGTGGSMMDSVKSAVGMDKK